MDSSQLKELCNIMAKMDEDQLPVFFEDLLTPTEIEAACDRWQVAKLLAKGIQYRTISEMTGVSTATITRVARFLSGGAGGYKIALDKLGSIQDEGKRKSTKRHHRDAEVR
jgi:TrpR-related protein YerC/YecD